MAARDEPRMLRIMGVLGMQSVLDPVAFQIRFQGASKHEAAEQLLALETSLAALNLPAEEVKIQRVKDDPTTQDVVTTLVLVLGTPALVAIARGLGSAIPKLAEGIAKRLAQVPSIEMTISDDAGRPVVLRASGGSIDTAAATLEKLFTRRSS